MKNKVSVEFVPVSKLKWPDEMMEDLSNSDVTWGGADLTLVSGATLRAALDEYWHPHLKDLADVDYVNLEG